MGVSLLSAAATSVSIFNAEPNPITNQCHIHQRLSTTAARRGKNESMIGQVLLPEVMALDGRRKPGEDVSTAEVLLGPCGYNKTRKESHFITCNRLIIIRPKVECKLIVYLLNTSIIT